MKKKLLLGLLVFVAVMGLAGCENGGIESTTNYDYDEYYEDANGDIDDEIQTDLDNDPATGVENEIGFDDLFGDGFVDGVFRDELAGFEFHLPAGWTYIPEHDLLEISLEMNLQSNQLVYYTLIANDEPNDTGLVAIYEDMTVDEFSMSMTAADIASEMLAMYADRPDVREIGEIFTEEISGDEYLAFRVYFYEFQGLEDGTLTFFARRLGDFMLTMSISGLADNNVLDYFR